MPTEPASPRTQLLKALSAYVLANGLANVSLRPLARAARTSDRMLIYHFGTKEKLIEAVLGQLASDLEASLTAALPVEKTRSLAASFTEIMQVLRSEDVRRYLLVWLEIVAAAGLGNERSKVIGGDMLRQFLPWLKARLPKDIDDPDAAAAALLALVEGCIVMDAVGMSTTADLAAHSIGILNA